MALVDIPTSSFVEVEQRALQGTHDFVFAIGDFGNQSRLGGPRLCQAGLDSGGIDPAQTFMKTTSRMILSSPTFRKTSSVSRTVRPVCLSYRIALVRLWTGHYAPVWEQAPPP
jgi:hypothetical protein